jgi:hypothetical protein
MFIRALIVPCAVLKGFTVSLADCYVEIAKYFFGLISRRTEITCHSCCFQMANSFFSHTSCLTQKNIPIIKTNQINSYTSSCTAIVIFGPF